MSIETVEATVVTDINSGLVKAAAALDKAKTVADKINAEIQNINSNWIEKIIPGLSPVATAVADIAGGLTAVIDAVDAIADGLAAQAKPPVAPTPPTNP
jgi:uncharacterized phage infection (PIP) family protein YhgE